MFFKKRLNNNVVVAIDDSNNELILVGRGIGYQMVVGNGVDKTRIEKVFVLKDSSATRQLQQLLETIPIEYVDLAERVFLYAKGNISTPISDSVIVHLSDHIHMAVNRARQGMEIKNMMLLEIQRFYRDEFRVGEYAVELTNCEFGVDFSSDEAGFIALHLVNAQLGLGSSTISLTKITTVVEEIERIVRMQLAIDVDADSVQYRRFITHLKFFAERLFQEKTHQTGDIGHTLGTIRAAYPEASKCVQKIGEFLERKYEHQLTDEESLYLNIHIAQILTVSR